MDQNQRELRRAAAKAFMESLDQLGKNLTTDADPIEQASPTQSQEPPQGLSIQALEDAANDIEQFISFSSPTPNPQASIPNPQSPTPNP